MSSETARQQRVEQAIAEYLEAADRGCPPSQEDHTARHPSLAHELREFFDAENEIAQLAADPDSPPRPAPRVPGRTRINAESSEAAPKPEAEKPPRSAPPRRKRVRYFGDYELLAEVARGGMGVVYKARQVNLDRIVALKMILAGKLASEDDVRRFYQEAESAANLDHPNIVPIFEVGQHGGQHFFSMGFIRGPSLAKAITRGPSPPRQAAATVQKIAEAIAYAHSKGVIHRDLKPANVLLARRENATDPQAGPDGASDARPSARLTDFDPKVTDFGLAKKSAGGSELTSTGDILGTPSYMPPEQAAGQLDAIGPEADIYSLGGILYCLLTGRPPFQAASVTDTLMQVLEQEPVAPRELNRQVPRDLETICLKCLQKDRRKRYASAGALANELGRYLRGEPIQARPVSRAERGWRWCRRNPLVASLTALVAFVLIVAAVVSTSFAVSERETRLLAEASERRAREAEGETTQELWRSYLHQARALRWSGRTGGKFEALETLSKAAAIRPSLALRNEAIACMALVDLRVAREWDGVPGGPLETTCVSFDATFERYARSDAEGNLSVRRVTSDEEIIRLPGPALPAWTLRFSPDGRSLAAVYHPPGSYSGDNRLILWDLSTGKPILDRSQPRSPRFREERVWDFSPDGRWLAAADPDRSIHIFDTSSGEESRRLETGIAAQTIRFDLEGARLAVAGFRKRVEFAIVDASDGKVLQTFALPAGVREVAWHPDGQRLAAGCYNAQIYLCDLESAESTVLEGHRHTVDGVAFNQRGDRLCSVDATGILKLWNPSIGGPLLSARIITRGWGRQLQLSADDRLLAYNINGSRIQLFELPRDDECVGLQGTGGQLTSFSPNGDLVGISGTRGVRIWDLATRQSLAHFPLRQARSVLFPPDGQSLIVRSLDGTFRWPLVSPRNEQRGWVFGGRETLVRGPNYGRAELFPDSRRLVITSSKGVGTLIDLDDREATQFQHHLMMHDVSVSPDGRWFATGGQNASIKIWNAHTGEHIRDLTPEGAHDPAAGPDDPATDPDEPPAANGAPREPLAEVKSARVEFSPDGRTLVTFDRNNNYRFWGVESWQPIRHPLESFSGSEYQSPTFSPDGKLITVMPERHLVRLVDFATGREIATLTDRHNRTCYDTAFSPDGSRLAVSVRGAVVIWNLHEIRRHLREIGLDW